jgi:hypothetical protein
MSLPLPACGERVGVRGRIRESERLERPPHPDLLPARGEKERAEFVARLRSTRPNAIALP